MDWDREEVARCALEQADIGAPVDPLRLAYRLGFKVGNGGPGCTGVLFDDLRLILVDEAERPERRGFAVAHEIGHSLQRKHGMPDSEWGANYLASALLLPRLEFEIDLRRCGWDLLCLKAKHPSASFEALARRIVALREAQAFVVDLPADEPQRWYSVPSGLRPGDAERDALAAALDTGAPAASDTGVMGWAVFEQTWRRVIVLGPRP